MKNSKKEIIAILGERIVNKIFLIRGKKVMIDRDLAELYEVETRALNQAVKRNIDRFPDDFMFQLDKEETNIWRSQIVMSAADKKGLRKSPLVFTEQGVAMLSSVLNSKKAIMVNIQIIRTFTQLRELLSTHKDLREKIENMEKKYDKQLEPISKITANNMKYSKQLEYPNTQISAKNRVSSVAEAKASPPSSSSVFSSKFGCLHHSLFLRQVLRNF